MAETLLEQPTPPVPNPADHPRRRSTWWWFVPFAAAVVLPGLVWTVSARPYAVRFDLMIGITAVVALTAALLLLILSRGMRRRLRWALGVSAVATLVLFQWPALTKVGSKSADLFSLPILADIVPVALAGAFIWIAVRRAGDWRFAFLSALGLGGLVLVLAIMTTTLLPARPPAASQAASTRGPDTVLIVLDGYTRADVLADEFAFDNSWFLEELESRGFDVADQATSNYPITFAALSAMYDLDYVYDTGQIGASQTERMRDVLAGDSAMLSLFKNAGYEIAFAENAWQGSLCGTLVDRCDQDGLATRVLWSVGQVTILAPLVNNVVTHPFHSVSYSQLQNLGALATLERTDRPRLTVAHVILPHPPFRRDAICAEVDGPGRRAFTTHEADLVDDRRDYWGQQATCTNKMVLAALDDVIAANPDTMIMLTGDHGSTTRLVFGNKANSRSDAMLRERMSILSAYRLPGCEGRVYPTITPVNGARALASCALGSELDPIEDRNLWVPGNGRGTVVDVAPRLNK